MRKNRVEVNPRHLLKNPNGLVPGNVSSYKDENRVKIKIRLIFALFVDAVSTS
jgi:hypothetical protein